MSKDIKLSATRVSTFLKCKKKYWFQYHENLPKLSKPAFKLGLACHEALELAGKIWVKKEKFEASDFKKIFKLYDEISIREGIEEMDVHKIGRDLVQSRLKSFSLGKIISLEETFGFKTGAYKDLKTVHGVPLIGAMDKVIELDSESLLIVDYKTSKTAPTPDQLKEDIQLSIYDLVASIIWPKYKRIVLCLDMLKSNPIYTYRTPEQRVKFDEYLFTIYNIMRNLKKKEAKASLHIFCPWCDYKEYCDKYQEAVNKKDYEFLPITRLTNDELIDEYTTIGSTAKILDTRKRELGMIIMEKIKMAGENLKGKTKQAYIRQTARVTYDIKTVSSLVEPEDFINLVNLNKKAVDSYCSKNLRVKKLIEDGATSNYSTPFLATKNL